MRCISVLLAALFVPGLLHAADPTATAYSYRECEGTSMPYPQRTVKDLVYPDSLTPVILNHVGRHGSRFLSSKKYTAMTLRYLERARSEGSITPEGKLLEGLCRRIDDVTAKRWGALDSLGMAEQRAIASRAHQAYPGLFVGTKVRAVSSYVPRCIMSMDEFTHQLTRLDNKVEIYTSSGRQNSSLLRPWDGVEAYTEYVESPEVAEAEAEDFPDAEAERLARRFLGASITLDSGEGRDFITSAFKVMAGAAASGVNADLKSLLTLPEMNTLWRAANLSRYLRRSATTLSQLAMDLSADLLLDLVASTDMAAEGKAEYAAELRFGHAETLMPLLALMRLKGCYYITNYFDTVGLHWKDFDIVPMSANLQMVLFRSSTGRLYLRTDLNEQPVPLIPGKSDIYVPWSQAKEYLSRCLPIDKRL